MKKVIRINGKNFFKSSYSKDGQYCVGVCLEDDKILVTNTKDKNGITCSFTKKEWKSFIKGVKDNEFNID